MPSLTFSILMDERDRQAFDDFLKGMKERMEGAEGRTKIRSIMLKHLGPLAQSERDYLDSGHSVSGALAMSLRERAGSGDRPGTISAFITPTAKSKDIQAHWSRGRKQQQGWASKMTGNATRRVFYGEIVARGHRIIRRNKAGVLFDTGAVAQPVPFAQQAADAIGDRQIDAAAEEILDYIFGSE